MHPGIVGVAFGAAIPAKIFVVAVAIVFAVGFVVLLVVTDQIVQGKAVVRGDEIDAGVGQPAVAARTGR